MKKAIAMCLIACMVMTGCGGSKGGAGEPQDVYKRQVLYG